jgi:DnaJ-class molecular chaperone with C-terminal Zn finger domain
MSNTNAESVPTYSGDLSQVSIPKLLFHFFASSSNGRLTLSREKTIKEMYLTNGRPVAVFSNLPHEQLGGYLVSKGVLTAEQLNKLPAEAGNRDDHIGDAILRQGIISSPDLFEHLRHHLLAKIYDIFGWRSGRYAFFQGQQYSGTAPVINLDPWEILSTGVRLGYDSDELRRLLEPLRHRQISIKNNPLVSLNQLVLAPLELKVFKSISDVSTLGGLINLLGGSGERDATVLAAFYLGFELDLLEVGQELKQAETPRNKPDETRSVSQREQEFQQKLVQMKGQNYFERLSLDLSATSADAAKAFMRYARTYHPDQIPITEPPLVKQLAADIFSLINEAQLTLSNDAKRKSYLQAIESGKTSDNVDVNKILESEMLFSRAETMTKASKFQAAVELLDQAIKLNPEEGEFLVYQGYASFFANPQAGSRHKDSCLQMISQGMKMRHDSLANGYYFTGLIYKVSRDEETSRDMFQKALSLDHNHTEAMRELRLLEMRKEKKGPRKK